MSLVGIFAEVQPLSQGERIPGHPGHLPAGDKNELARECGRDQVCFRIHPQRGAYHELLHHHCEAHQ